MWTLWACALRAVRLRIGRRVLVVVAVVGPRSIPACWTQWPASRSALPTRVCLYSRFRQRLRRVSSGVMHLLTYREPLSHLLAHMISHKTHVSLAVWLSSSGCVFAGSQIASLFERVQQQPVVSSGPLEVRSGAQDASLQNDAAVRVSNECVDALAVVIHALRPPIRETLSQSSRCSLTVLPATLTQLAQFKKDLEANARKLADLLQQQSLVSATLRFARQSLALSSYPDSICLALPFLAHCSAFSCLLPVSCREKASVADVQQMEKLLSDKADKTVLDSLVDVKVGKDELEAVRVLFSAAVY